MAFLATEIKQIFMPKISIQKLVSVFPVFIIIFYYDSLYNMSKLNTMSITMSGRDWQKFSELRCLVPWIVFIWRSKNLPGDPDWRTWVEKLVSLSETAGPTCPFGCGMVCPGSFIHKHQSRAIAIFPAEEVNYLQVMWQKRDKGEFWRLTPTALW